MKAVIDTNVWLDLLVFEDPGARALAGAIAEGRVTVLATAEMRAEWLDVIARPQFALDESARERAAAEFDRIAQPRETAPRCALSCRDPADQKFIDLAVAAGAAWLITKDKALLALRRAAERGHGLRIAAPASAGAL